MLKYFARLATLFLLVLSCAQAQCQSASVEGAGRAARSADGPMIVTPRVKMALGAVQRLEGANIDVDTMGGRAHTVTLLGRVRDLEQKKLAGDIARRNAPGYKIINRLRTSGEVEEVRSAVGDALVMSQGLSGAEISVTAEADGRTIRLSGVARSAVQKSLAGSIARRSGRGFTIINSLRVGGKSQAPPVPRAASVNIAIKVALRNDRAMSGSNIEVETGPDGIELRVILRGTVRTREQKRRALYIARQEAPGMRIVNRLRVAPSSNS